MKYGIDTLCANHGDWISGVRIGLVAHAASVGADGTHSAAILRKRSDAHLCALFGPEHGFFSHGGAGEKVAHGRHSKWRIPIHSLYGATRKPTAKMMRGIDTVVFDLQDLAARPYTYVSTLRLILEAAARHGKRVIVADRPDPLASVIDGPMLQPRFQRFVSAIPSPVAYGMTPGETALWLKQTLKLKLDLRVARVTGYRRNAFRGKQWPKWVPPSPAIPSWESGLCFPITVFFEALPSVDHGRGAKMPFQLIGAPWMDARAVCGELKDQKLSGVSFEPCDYRAGTGIYKGQTVRGLRLHVYRPRTMRPIAIAVALIETLQRVHGPEKLWKHKDARPAFFDQLMGTDRVRRALQRGDSAEMILAKWAKEVERFEKQRKKCLLYAE